jgi:hypothetical protein
MTCACTAHPHRCHDPATGDDALCDHCRAGCILVGDGTYFVHLHTGSDDAGSWSMSDIEPRMQRVRDNCTGVVTAWSREFWDEPPGGGCEGSP